MQNILQVKKQMPFIGHKIETTTDNFGNLIRKNCLFVDKSLMIKEFFDGMDVSVIIRPRRFGKTINLSMLQHFFSAEIAGESTAGLFDHLAVAKEENGDFLKKHQGKYPVIFITFKDSKESSLESTINQMRILIQKLYREHEKCLRSAKLNPSDKEMFQKYLAGSADNTELQAAIAFLSEFLYKAHGKKAIILIDEYDSPLTHAYQHHFLEPLSDFMRDMLSAALKTNPFLEKGLMTGILRVSKNNMLSGLNNLEVYTLFSTEYRQYFGFTEDEVKELVHCTKNDINLEEIKAYYNGYNIGEMVIYNPWSTMKFLDKKELAPYWVATANDGLIRDIFLNSSDDTKALLSLLMQKEPIESNINANLRFEDLMEDPDALWTLLLFCGYLTVIDKERSDLGLMCRLRIPNREILTQYRQIFNDWLGKKIGQMHYSSFLKNLLLGNVDEFSHTLSEYLLHSFSFRDVGNRSDWEGDTRHQSEKFYPGFVMGLIASIQETHWVDSNKESGLGLYDVILTPKDDRYAMGIILEFKYTKKATSLKKEAEKAIQQIDKKQYDALLKRSSQIKQILKVGLAFCEKSVIIAHRVENSL